MTAIANAFFAAPVCRSGDVGMSAPRGKEFLIARRSHPRDIARPGASRRIVAVADETCPLDRHFEIDAADRSHRPYPWRRKSPSRPMPPRRSRLMAGFAAMR